MPAMTQKWETWVAGLILIVFLALTTLPYVVAGNASDQAYVFSGFLINPIDGNSYLAKMRQGHEGNWLFVLPYTQEPGSPAAINMYYLLLGHIARWTGFSLVFVFHAARVIGALGLAIVLLGFFRRVFEPAWMRLLALALALFGSGLGWLAIAFGLFTSDFWVAEAFPFLASFVNPHFPLGMAIQVWLLYPLADKRPLTWMHRAALVLTSAVLSIVYPFGLSVALVVLAAWCLWSYWRRSNWQNEVWRVACIVAGGGPYILYSLWIVNTHPVLLIWNAQNITPSPGLLNLLLSLSPAILLGAWAAYHVVRTPDSRFQFFVLWLFLGILILYLPVNIQRRLSSALYVCVVTLAVFAIGQLRLRTGLRNVVTISLVLLAIPTTALLLLGSLNAIRNRDADIFLYRDEALAYAWLDANASRDSLVIASPKTGNSIPAYTDARVVYGHPFETANAVEREAVVTGFFAGELSSARALEMLDSEKADYLFYGPREREIGPLPELAGWHVVFEQGGVQIWSPGE